MGTFHSDKGALHGITVIVRMKDGSAWVGRCDTVNDDGVFLNDCDHHTEGKDGRSVQEFLEAAKQWGHWPNIKHAEIPATEVAEVLRLASLP